MSSSVIFLVLVVWQAFGLFAQTVAPKPGVEPPKTVPQGVGVPKPSVDPTAGTWKYTETDALPPMVKHRNDHSTFSITIKDDGGVWTVTTALKFPDGPVTDVSALEKGTLIVRKESFKHFLHQDQPWKPVAISLDFTGKKSHRHHEVCRSSGQANRGRIEWAGIC